MISIKFGISGSQILAQSGSQHWSSLYNEKDASAPAYSFAGNPDTGIYRQSPRKPGEVRRHSCECQKSDGRWVSIDHVEDDNGYHWEYNGKAHPSEGHWDSYIYGGLPWETQKRKRSQGILIALLKKIGLE